MTHYQGDLEPVLLASGTEITAGGSTTYQLGTETSSTVTARLGSMVFYAYVTTTVVVTGNITVTYTEKIYDFDMATSKTAVIPLRAVGTNKYKGVKEFTNTNTAVILKSIQNNLTDKTATYKIYITGKIMY